jgi:hypothetical protein
MAAAAATKLAVNVIRATTTIFQHAAAPVAGRV